MSALHAKTVVELGQAYRSKQTSPVAVVETLLERIERLEPAFNAIITLDRAGALRAATVCAQEMAAGTYRGPLHGIPIGIKDVIDVAGVPTTCSSAILRDAVARKDAAVVARLRAAGAIIFGKLSTHEFALGGPSFDLPFPPARNPWNRDHHPGGSSSGAGAAVAAGFMPAAIGTDTAGSVRNPAGACGIVGLKPTYDLVSRTGVFPLAYSLDHVGPLVRSVADAAALLEVMAEPPQNAAPYTNAPGAGVKGLRIGFVRHFHETDMPASPDVAAALNRAAQILRDEGAVVETVTLPNLNRFSAVSRTILTAEAWAIHQRWLCERPQDYAQSTRQRLLAGAFVTAGDLLQAQRLRGEMIAAVESVLRTYDVLMTANAMEPACRIDDAAELARTYALQARTPFNVTGHPAIVLMAGLSNGLPVSVQFAGRYFDEAMLFRVASAFERASGYANCGPPEPH